VASIQIALIDDELRRQPEHEAKLLGAGLEQARLVATPRGLTEVNALLHHHLHDLLDERELADQVLHSHGDEGRAILVVDCL
jgi:hypothetical protein